MFKRIPQFLRSLSLLAAIGVVGGALALPSAPQTTASSHREAPMISQDPVADITDLYAYVSPDRPDSVTLIMNTNPYESPAGGPNFHRFSDDVLYSINIDNNGDAQADMTYNFRFKTTYQNPNTFLYNTGPINSLTDPNWNIRQTMTVSRMMGGQETVLGQNLPTPPTYIGPKSTPNYGKLVNEAIRNLECSQNTSGGWMPNCGILVFAGQRADPFFVDLGGTFDLLTIRDLPGNHGGGIDSIAGYNVQTIALQLPIASVTRDRSRPSDPKDAAAVIGVWATTSRQKTQVLNPGAAATMSGDWVQVARLGHPLVNEVVIPVGKKDLFNSSMPKDDGQFLNSVTDPELGKLLTALYNIPTPPAPRNDLVQVFLTGVPGLTQPPNVTPSEELRLNVAVPPNAAPNRLGVLGNDLAGYPNGRRLGDDVVDIALRAVSGILVPGFNNAPGNQLGDGVDKSGAPNLGTFPYVPTPYRGYDQ